jgi:RHS repeat-associated protein
MPVTDRGFTCHEHLEDFGLINMNGRMYDPLLGRFLSVDSLSYIILFIRQIILF